MNKKLKNLLIIAMFSAVAFVLQFFEFPLPMLIPPFIKMDFSDLPELLATFMLGSPAGICVCLIKNLLHLIDSSSGGVGELSNFLLGAVLCVVSDICYRRKRTKRGALIAMLIGSLAMGAASLPLNCFIVYPVYYVIFAPESAVLAAYQAIIPAVKSIPAALLIFNVPFTVAKGLICSGITFVLYKRLKKVLKL